MSVRVRMAPSPTGFLHIGGVRTFLFNWLFARRHGGECLLRIENTDTSREVAEAAQQIQDSLRWLGIEWDGPVTFQLERLGRCRQEARRLVAEGAAYEDEGAIRFRMPDEGTTAWDDLVLGRIEVENATIEDLVILRSDGRPTYNFASPVEDWLDGFSLERVQLSPATLDYQKLDWMNGVYIRALPPEKFADALVRYLRDEGYDWDEELVRRAAPLVQEKIKRLGEFPGFARFFFEDVRPDPALVDGSRPILQAAADRLPRVAPFA